MAGVYGDLLSFFPELFITVPYFIKEPKVGAGYETTATGMTDVIIQPEKNFTIAVGANTQTKSKDILDLTDKEYIWAPEDSPLKPGMYITDDNGKLCAIIGRADYTLYGGFYRFEFEIVQGTQGDRPVAAIKQGKF